MERKNVFRQARTFILESDAFTGLAAKMIMTKAVDVPFRPIFRALDIEYKLDKIQSDSDKKIAKEFYEDMARARE